MPAIQSVLSLVLTKVRITALYDLAKQPEAFTHPARDGHTVEGARALSRLRSESKVD